MKKLSSSILIFILAIIIWLFSNFVIADFNETLSGLIKDLSAILLFVALILFFIEKKKKKKKEI